MITARQAYCEKCKDYLGDGHECDNCDYCSSDGSRNKDVIDNEREKDNE